MALMTCAKCSNRFSNQLPACPQCGIDPHATDSAQQRKIALRDFRTRIYHLNMSSYLALTICTAGFILYWSASRHAQPPGMLSWGLIGLGAGGYLLIRLLMIQAKLKYRKTSKR